MSGDGVELKISGYEELYKTLAEFTPKLRKRAVRNALAAGARVVRDAIKPGVPVLKNAMKAPYRKPGTVRDAIAVRTSKIAARAGDVGVFVNVKPAKGANRGGKNPNDPFYGKFVQWGYRSPSGRVMPGAHFLEKGVAVLGNALAVFEATLGPQIQRLDQNPRDPL